MNYTEYDDIATEETIPELTTIKLARGKRRKDIKNLASDLVALPQKDGVSIDSYQKDGSREHRILHRAYNRYKDKKDRNDLENTSLAEVNTWDKDSQEKWFTAQMNSGARNVLPGMLTAASLPWAITSLTAFPLIEGIGAVGGAVGGSVGQSIGSKIDSRRHGLSNAALTGSLLGGTLGGLVGAKTGNSVQTKIINTFLDKPLYHNTVQNLAAPRTHDLEDLQHVVKKSDSFNDGFSNILHKRVSPTNTKKIARALSKTIDDVPAERITNYSNWKYLDDLTRTDSSKIFDGTSYKEITSGPDLVTQIVAKSSDTGPYLNTPLSTASTNSAYFTSEGLMPGTWSNNLWFQEGGGYFVSQPRTSMSPTIKMGKHEYPASNWNRKYRGLEIPEIPRHVTAVMDADFKKNMGRNLWSSSSSAVDPVFVSEQGIPYEGLKHIVEYDPVLKTFWRYNK